MSTAVNSQNDINWNAWKKYIDELMEASPTRIKPATSPPKQQPKKVNPQKAEVKEADANKKVRDCCVAAGIPPVCHSRCNYDQVTANLVS